MLPPTVLFVKIREIFGGPWVAVHRRPVVDRKGDPEHEEVPCGRGTVMTPSSLSGSTRTSGDT
jgi:hypothetical protein